MLDVSEVALSGRAGDRGRRLALPVDQIRTDRVVLVAGRWRELAARLVEREREHVGLLVRQPLHAAVPARRPERCPVIERRLDLGPRVPGMHVEWHVCCGRSIGWTWSTRASSSSNNSASSAHTCGWAAQPSPCRFEVVAGSIDEHRGQEHPQQPAIALVEHADAQRGARWRANSRYRAIRSSSSTWSRRPTARRSAVSSSPAADVGMPAARRSSVQLRLLA